MAVNAVSPTTAPAAAIGASGATATSSSKDGGFDAMLAKLRGEGSGASGAAKPTADADTEDRFLKLLVAQMNNQDPLNPLDNSQVTSQLAQINTVKGIDKLNTALQTLIERTGTGSATDAAGMVGRHVLIDGNTLELPKDGIAKGGFELASDAASVRIEILDKSGAVVDAITRGSLPAGMQTFEWNGKVGDKVLDPGRYTIRAQAAGATGPIEVKPLAAVPVQAVVRGADGVVLQLGPAGSKALDDVRGIL
jgi:flagellar basal-body rod modification protein FlgD